MTNVEKDAIAHGWQRSGNYPYTEWTRTSRCSKHLPHYLEVHVTEPDDDGYTIRLRAKTFGGGPTVDITRFRDFDHVNEHCERHGHDHCDMEYNGPWD